MACKAHCVALTGRFQKTDLAKAFDKTVATSAMAASGKRVSGLSSHEALAINRFGDEASYEILLQSWT